MVVSRNIRWKKAREFAGKKEGEREREREREEEEQSTEVRDSARHELFSAPAV